MKLLVVIACLLACAGGAMAREDWQTPDWKPTGDLSRQEDRALASGALAASVVGADGRRDLLLVERASTQSCGDYDFSVFGPVNFSGKRPAQPEFSYCAGALKYRPNGNDFLVSGIRVGSDVSGPSGWVFEDVRLSRERGTWTETVVMVIDYQDGKPKILQKN